METVKIILIIAGVAVMPTNVFVSYRVTVSDLYETHQKFAQCAMIRLLPLLGVGPAHATMQEPKIKPGSHPRNSSTYGIGDFGLGDSGGSGDYFGGHDSH